MPFEDVEVLHGDTQVAPRGLDTYGSRSLVVGGQALVMAADRVIAKAKPIAAHMLEASVDDIEFVDGTFKVKGTDNGKAMAEVVWAAFTAHDLPEGVEPTLDAEATFDPVNFSFPHGTHLCATEVDTETGQVTMRSYVSVDDIGNIINPLIVEGQMHGGIVQGIAQALWEEAVYDDQGTLVSGSFVDYTLPTSADTISLRHRQHRLAVDHQRPRRQGRRRGRLHRLHPGGRQRRRRRAATAGDQRHPDAVHARAGLEGHPVGRVQRATPPPWSRPSRTSTPERPTRTHPAYRTDRLDERSRPVIPASFDYLAPTSVADALAALAEAGDDAKVMAGGQSLLPILRMRLNAPDKVIDLGRIKELQGVTEDGDHVVIGAMTTYADVLASDLVRQHAGLLTDAIAEVADPQIRHRGTVGGALVHADPAGDVGAPALALDTEFVITGPGGERTVAAGDFFQDLFETAVGEGELLTAIRIPKHTGWGHRYEKFVRVSHQWSIVAVAATVRVDGWQHRRSQDRADQHGVDPAARDRGRAGPRGQGRDRRGCA